MLPKYIFFPFFPSAITMFSKAPYDLPNTLINIYTKHKLMYMEFKIIAVQQVLGYMYFAQVDIAVTKKSLCCAVQMWITFSSLPSALLSPSLSQH